jgi:acetyl-CoA carboxylase carboxyl transferase subunit alpha
VTLQACRWASQWDIVKDLLKNFGAMHLDFEGPLALLNERIESLKVLPETSQHKIQDEIQRLEKKAEKLLAETYANLTPWQKVQVSRHPGRPRTKDYIARMIRHFVPLSGDRCFGEDAAVSVGMGTFKGMAVMIIGHEKGCDTLSRLAHNFGMAHPEGYRKAIRAVKLAERWGVPVLFLVDTPGAYAGMQAEERGQSQAIAECIEACLSAKTPLLSVIIGEGGSGGAVAFASANYVAMLEHSVYSVISPEGCASILWKTAEKRQEAALAQKLTAKDLLGFGVIDAVIAEPLGGAHRSPTATIDRVADALYAQLGKMGDNKNWQDLRQQRFLALGRSGPLA